jgi:hypothetical protein
MPIQDINPDLSGSAILKLIEYMTQISENYGKLLLLISNIEHILQQNPNLRDFNVAIDKLTENRKYLEEINMRLTRRTEDVVVFREELLSCFSGINNHINKIKTLATELDIEQFIKHFKNVEKIIELLNAREKLCKEECLDCIKDAGETARRINILLDWLKVRIYILIGVPLGILLIVEFGHRILSSVKIFFEWLK